VDGYGGYNAVAAQEGVIRVGCWAHVRRKFEAALVIGSHTGTSLAEKFIEKIKKLFMLERGFVSLTSEERLKSRKEKSTRIIADIRTSLNEALPKVPQKSKLGLALHYIDNEWDGLVRFLENGNLSLSNNRIENYVRPFAIGRKNWLFCDTTAGAQASSVLYSIVVSAKENDLDVFQYLDTLFRELPKILKENPQADLSPYLPHVWKPPSPPTG
jgi:transposase